MSINPGIVPERTLDLSTKATPIERSVAVKVLVYPDGTVRLVTGSGVRLTFAMEEMERLRYFLSGRDPK